MCIRCFPPQLVDLKWPDHERFFRIISGRRCNNLNHLYLMPADEEELRVRRRIFVVLALRSDDDGLIVDARDLPFSASSSFTG